MAFDGVEYGRLSLTPPIYAHPNATAVGRVLADGVDGSYMYMRRNAQLCLYQTYGHYLRSWLAYVATNHFAAETAWFDIAEAVVYVPTWATKLVGRAFFRISHGSAANVHHRIVATDGTNTDTGDDYRSEIETQPPPAAGPVVTFEGIEQLVDVDVDLSTVTLGADVTVRLQAYAVDSAGAALPYSPLFVAAFWEAVD